MEMNEKLDRIREIASEIDRLSRELQDLLDIEHTFAQSEVPNQIASTSVSERVPNIVENERQIRVGSRVKITNNYKNMSGLLGTVRKINSLFLSIRLDNGETIRKAKYNVELVIGWKLKKITVIIY